MSLSIGTGGFGLLGPNGAGKSTLMRIQATHQEADSGSSIKIDTTKGVKVDNANGVKTDIACSNGVIRVIDSVLMPK